MGLRTAEGRGAGCSREIVLIIAEGQATSQRTSIM